ncbi:uncharacterized protein BJ212DRAFT_1325528 [Suillus subaureus]|uniref:Uncharacterized protein n=1 Tax=Suillus subaureus TaxID=48587 RepID=A0A9P7EKW5_9AGAM|nr:uncharacterized protein BJ212DRAFT_1325528 [Suillus subaureus]KAG1823615.1 hypothetical protein BJ212DRAFT_1325528 [Suillus subaureus]
MDDILYQYQALQNEIETEVIDDEESALIAATVLLLPNPQMNTPWQVLFAS